MTKVQSYKIDKFRFVNFYRQIEICSTPEMFIVKVHACVDFY